jgi:hypothetical protein
MVDNPIESEIEFYFEKSHLFRVIYVDGAVGAISPSNQLIHMSIFNERVPVPRRIVHAVSGGVVGEPQALGREVIEKRDVRQGVFREIEADLVFSVDTAVVLRAWLMIELKKSNTGKNYVRLRKSRVADNDYD